MRGLFTKAVRRFEELANMRLKQAVVDRTVAIVERAAELTPVDTGAAQSRWAVSVGDGPPPALVDEPGLGPSGVADRARRLLESLRTGSVRLRVYNDSPYINVLEYGDGHTRPPHAMLRRALAEAEGR